MLPFVHVAGHTIYSFGLVFGCAICLGWFSVIHYLRLHDIAVNELAFGVCLIGSGLLGAKLDYALIYSLFVDRQQPWTSTVFHSGGGYTYLGSIVLASLVAVAYILIHRLPLLRMFDGLFCVGLSYAVGRIGCFLAGDGDYGIPSTLPWAVSFPRGVVPTTDRVHPTMLYSSLWEFLIFAVLWKLSRPGRRPQLKPGILLAIYLIASGAGRFAVEFLGRNPVIAFGLTESQLVSLAFVTGGGILLAQLYSTSESVNVPGRGKRQKQCKSLHRGMDSSAVCGL